MFAKIAIVFATMTIGCAAAPAEVEAPNRSVTTFDVPADLAAAFDSAAAEWRAFGFDFSRADCADGYCSRVAIVADPCSAIWPNGPSNVLGCAYSLRDVDGVPTWDSAMKAAATLTALEFHIELAPGVDYRREILHELGHVAGFCHVAGPTLMNAVANSAAHLSVDDLAEPCSQ